MNVDSSCKHVPAGTTPSVSPVTTLRKTMSSWRQYSSAIGSDPSDNALRLRSGGVSSRTGTHSARSKRASSDLQDPRPPEGGSGPAEPGYVERTTRFEPATLTLATEIKPSNPSEPDRPTPRNPEDRPVSPSQTGQTVDRSTIRRSRLPPQRSGCCSEPAWPSPDHQVAATDAAIAHAGLELLKLLGRDPSPLGATGQSS